MKILKPLILVVLLVGGGIAIYTQVYPLFKKKEKEDLFKPGLYLSQSDASRASAMSIDSTAGVHLLHSTLFTDFVSVDMPNDSLGLQIKTCGFAKGLQLNYQDSISTPVNFNSCVVNGLYLNKQNKPTLRSIPAAPIYLHLVLGNHTSSQSIHNISSTISFSNSVLQGKIDFSGCKFMNTVPLLSGTVLPDTLDFSEAFFAATLDMTSAIANPNGYTYINLLHANIDKIKMQYHNFKLFFPEEVINNADRHDEVSSTYDKLLASMDANGFKDSYEDLDCEYQLWKGTRKHEEGNYFTKNINGLIAGIKSGGAYISYVWWRFGYAKERVILWCLLFIAIFASYNEWNYRKVLDAYPIENLDLRSESEEVFQKKKQSFSIFYTFIVFFRVSLDFKKVDFSNRVTYVLLAQYLIGLICTAFLINLILK